MAVDPNNFWPGFGNDTGLPEITCDDSYDGLAQLVLSYYDIPCSSSIGGSLPDLDIKHMDAMQVIKLSLLEQSADDNKLYEPIMNSDGEVEFKSIGDYVGFSGNDIYYELQTSTYKEGCSGVMITGKKPLNYRKPIEWKSIWENGSMEIHDSGIMFNNRCLQDGFNQYCTIIYNDPHLLNSSYEDGISNLYEISKEEGNVYDTITGYAHYIDWDRDEILDKNVSITQSNSAKILIELSLDTKGLGKLNRRPPIDPELSENLDCYVNENAVSYEDGLEVPISEKFRFENVRGITEDKFVGIENVYVVGLFIDHLYGEPPTDVDALNRDAEYGSANVWASINNSHDQIFTLSRGEHFEVAYENEETGNPVQPYIVFADNSLKTDPIGMTENGKTHFYIDFYCSYALTDEGSPRFEDDGYILPMSKSEGILVKQIFVVANLNTPSINIYHPIGWNNRAREVAESLEYLVAPLITVDEPTPVAFNGTLLDQISSKIDHDPTTAQNFEDTDFERAADQMSAGGGMSMTLSFLDAEQVTKLSGALYNYLNSGTGINSTYICGPDSEPLLGGKAPNGGIVNSISYSYQDSNSYTISVNSGPKSMGNFAQAGVGGPSFKATEDVSCKGTIIQDMGNNIHFKVRVDGIGDRIAVNMAPEILRVGDVVSCSLHNNPVEA